MKNDHGKEYDLMSKVAKHIGDAKTLELTNEMKRIRDAAYDIMENEDLSKEARVKMRELFVEQFKLGMKTCTQYFISKGILNED